MLWRGSILGAKDIVIKPISSKDGNRICKLYHYSGKVVPNSQVHLGVFYNGRCEGVMQFGPSLAKRKTMSIVPGTSFNGFIELNRMAFSDILPRYSESRALSIAHKIIKKEYPFIDWVVSFADGCQCGDGTIYRAAGYKLTQIKKNTSMWVNINTGEKMQDMQFYHKMIKRDKSWEKLPGYMLRYIYFLKDKPENKLVKIIPFSDIPNEVKMYKGIKRIEHESNASVYQTGESGAIPTDALHLTKCGENG